MITVKRWEPFDYSDGVPEIIQTELPAFANVCLEWRGPGPVAHNFLPRARL
jgi:hypothetical protein